VPLDRLIGDTFVLKRTPGAFRISFDRVDTDDGWQRSLAGRKEGVSVLDERGVPL
jgi:hypothetical protein